MSRNARRVNNESFGDYYASEGYTEENDNRDEKYSTDGESEFSRLSSRPFDMDPRLENREYNLRNFAGKGPKGYRRSDDSIYEDVCEALMRNPEVDASDIAVTVDEGIVRLKGIVHSRQEKKAAELSIERIKGVMDIHNELHLRMRQGEGHH